MVLCFTSICSRASTRVGRVSFFFRVILIAVLMDLTFAKNPIAHQKNDTKALLYVSFGLIVFLIGMLVAYIARELCPRGPIFTSLDLDEIRLERLDDIESSLKSNINLLKNKLEYHRKKKTQVQTDRDIKRRLGERVEKFNDKGRSIYGEAWDEGDIPVKAVVSMTTEEVVGLRQEAEQIVQQRQQEEKEDLWKLWNEMRQDEHKAGSSTTNNSNNNSNSNAKSAFAANQALLQRDSNNNTTTTNNTTNGKGNMQYTYKGSSNPMFAAAGSMSSNNINNNTRNNAFELGGEGKFGSSPNKSSNNSNNNNNYSSNNSNSYYDNLPSAADESQGLLRNKTQSGSQLRSPPPVLDLSKLTTAPNHIKPPSSKPPPGTYLQQQQQQQRGSLNSGLGQGSEYSLNIAMPNHTLPSNSANNNNTNNAGQYKNDVITASINRGPSATGGALPRPSHLGNNINNNNNSSSSANGSTGEGSTATGVNSGTSRPSLRSYPSGKRPAPPAGPKPPPRANTGGSSDGAVVNPINNISTLNNSVGGGGAGSVKRPPPPTLAPPPGYIPGNSSKNRAAAASSNNNGSQKQQQQGNNDKEA